MPNLKYYSSSRSDRTKSCQDSWCPCRDLKSEPSRMLIRSTNYELRCSEIVSHQNCINEDMKSVSILSNVCYNSV